MKLPEELISLGLIESAEPDRAVAAQWIDDARRHLDSARTVESKDPSGAYALAYDSARKSAAAALLMNGYRTRFPGSHQALARYARALSEELAEPALERVDLLRRNRNRSEYGTRTFGTAEVAEAIAITQSVVEACATRI